MSNEKAVTAFGIEYPSQAAAARAHGISCATVRLRLGKGWGVERSLSTPPRRGGQRVPCTIRGVTYRTEREGCRALGMSEWRAKSMRMFYGITLTQYVERFDLQSGCCDICEAPMALGGVNTHVDHCHRTGRIRGILCLRCNKRMVVFDLPEEEQANYLNYRDSHDWEEVADCRGKVDGA